MVTALSDRQGTTQPCAVPSRPPSPPGGLNRTQGSENPPPAGGGPPGTVMLSGTTISKGWRLRLRRRPADARHHQHPLQLRDPRPRLRQRDRLPPDHLVKLRLVSHLHVP